MLILIKKIPDVSGLVTTTVLNRKIGEVENKISDARDLATTTVLNTKVGEIETKIFVYGLVKKVDYNAKILDIEGKYCTTSEYNKFISEVRETKRKKRLAHKSDIVNLIKILI